MPHLPYANRAQAGRALAGALHDYAGRDLLILGLPRGGVPVAFEVANAFEAELDVMLVRKLGVPGHEELAMGAIASGGAQVLNDDVLSRLTISREQIDRVTRQQREELKRREQTYRGDRPDRVMKNKTVILIDDGLATGSTMLAAVQALQQLQPSEIIVAVPVGPPEACARLHEHVGTIICLATPEPFGGVGRWFTDFSQTTDEEVRDLLSSAWKRRPHTEDVSPQRPTENHGER